MTAVYTKNKEEMSISTGYVQNTVCPFDAFTASLRFNVAYIYCQRSDAKHVMILYFV